MGAQFGEEEGEQEEGYKGYSVISFSNQHPKMTQLKGGRSEPTTGLFEDVAVCFITASHTCLEKLTSLPFPVGTVVEAFEELLVVPIADSIEGFTLRVLSAIDKQIYAVGMSLKGSIASTSEQVNLVLTGLLKRGLLGVSADFWVQHESLMGERVQRIVDLLNKVPFLSVATPFVCAISAPLVNAMSDWLVEHSQSQDKWIRFQFKEEKDDGGREFNGMEEKSQDLQKPVQVKDEVKADEEIKVKVINTKEDEEGPRLGNERKGRQEDKVSEVKGQVHAVKKTEDASDVSTVLEMIDAGWLLGSGGAISPRTHAAATSPKPPSNAKKAGHLETEERRIKALTSQTSRKFFCQVECGCEVEVVEEEDV